MLWLYRPVLDIVFVANAIEDRCAEIAPAWSIAAFGQVGESHSVVNLHGVDGIRKYGNDTAPEACATHLSGVIAELDVGELRNAVDGEKHSKLAFCQALLADVDMVYCDVGGVTSLSVLGTLLDLSAWFVPNHEDRLPQGFLLLSVQDRVMYLRDQTSGWGFAARPCRYSDQIFEGERA